jgi:flavodoxin
MRTKNISRREFVAGVAAVAGATILVACTPAKNSPLPEGSQSNGPSPSSTQTQTGNEGGIMKVFIVYDSVYGNTQKIAEAMIDGIGSNCEPIITKVQDATVADIEGVDLFIVGGPTHGGTFTEPVKNFFASIPANGLKGIKSAAFDTSFTEETQGAFVRFLMTTLGYAAPKIAKKLAGKGADVLTSEIFYVLDTEGPLKEGEIERASQWAAALVNQALS